MAFGRLSSILEYIYQLPVIKWWKCIEMSCLFVSDLWTMCQHQAHRCSVLLQVITTWLATDAAKARLGNFSSSYSCAISSQWSATSAQWKSNIGSSFQRRNCLRVWSFSSKCAIKGLQELSAGPTNAVGNSNTPGMGPSLANNSMGYTRIFARAVSNQGPWITVLMI